MASFALLSSTRFDPFLTNLKWNNDQNGASSPFLLLHYHLDRLQAAAKVHGWEEAHNALSFDPFQAECHRAVQEYPDAERPIAFKVRFLENFQFAVFT